MCQCADLQWVVLSDTRTTPSRRFATYYFANRRLGRACYVVVHARSSSVDVSEWKNLAVPRIAFFKCFAPTPVFAQTPIRTVTPMPRNQANLLLLSRTDSSSVPRLGCRGEGMFRKKALCQAHWRHHDRTTKLSSMITHASARTVRKDCACW